MRVVETPGRTSNLDGVEVNLQGGIRREENRQSIPRRRGETLWWFRGIRWFSGKENKRAATEARKYYVRRDIPTDK